VPKMITIGSVGSAPHIREIYSYQKCLPFFYSSTRLQPEREQPAGPNRTIMPQSTQIFSRKCLLGVSIFAKKFLGVIFAPKN
jgi:hypothetical protein